MELLRRNDSFSTREMALCHRQIKDRRSLPFHLAVTLHCITRGSETVDSRAEVAFVLHVVRINVVCYQAVA
eukprot:4632791-Amphidinium_carterae.1